MRVIHKLTVDSGFQPIFHPQDIERCLMTPSVAGVHYNKSPQFSRSREGGVGRTGHTKSLMGNSDPSFCK